MMMTEESKLSLRAIKNANIICSISELFGLSLSEAANMYYTSDTSRLVEDGVSDLHCRSEKYLATLVWDEFHKN